MAKDLKFVLLLDCYGELLTEKQREAMELYYCEDLSLAEIGAAPGITRQAVRSYIKRAEELLLNYEEKLRFAEKLGKMRDSFGKISRAVEAVGACEQKEIILNEIKKCSEIL